MKDHFRYSLRAFVPGQEDAPVLLDEMQQQRATAKALAADVYQTPWSEVISHLEIFGTQTLLVQRGVFDPDYREEHQAFYARQHRAVDRECIRIHAFSTPAGPYLTAANADVSVRRKAVLAFLDAASADEDSYLGFVTLRPLQHAPVGATILRLPDENTPTVWDRFDVHIAGREFKVAGTPFLQQDSAVGVCAQASMWMALRSLRRRHGNASYSPAELTEAATHYLAADRPLPGRQGLTTGQMLDAIRFAGHDPLHVQLRNVNDKSRPKAEVIADAAPYIDSGLPVLMVLAKSSADGTEPPAGQATAPAQQETPFDPAGHVVVAIGLQTASSRVSDSRKTVQAHHPVQVDLGYWPASNWVRGFVVHNDAVGPYNALESREPKKLEPPDYFIEDACGLIVVLPSEIFTNAREIGDLALRAFWRACAFAFATAGVNEAKAPNDLVLRPVLCTRHAFRKWARNDPDLHQEIKERYCTDTLPRFVWVAEFHDVHTFNPNDESVKSRVGEVVLDASADPYNGDAHIFTTIVDGVLVDGPGKTIKGLVAFENDAGDVKYEKDFGPISRGGMIREPWCCS